MKSIILILCISACAAGVKAQDLSAAEVKDLVNSKTYSFEAQTATPTAGSLKHLTPGYSLKLSGDSLIAHLPYYGKAYSASMNPADAGINIVTTNFEYKASEGKKNSHEVSLKTKDKVYNAEFTLTIYDDGSAYLRVSSADRQPISYNGYVQAVHK